jgi:tRNA threonylcarbamoyladenosine biosynthesis protein TsaB
VVTLAFDTATSVVASALVRDGEPLAERVSKPRSVLEDVDGLLREAGLEPEGLDQLAVGTGPGSFTGVRIGLATARALAFALGLPAAGVSTLDALAAGAPGALPVIDAKRGEIFALLDGDLWCLRPDELDLPSGTLCVGDGAVRYRSILEKQGAVIPADESDQHVPRARFHAVLARDFGPAEGIEPLYVRVPDFLGRAKKDEKA